MACDHVEESVGPRESDIHLPFTAACGIANRGIVVPHNAGPDEGLAPPVGIGVPFSAFHRTDDAFDQGAFGQNLLHPQVATNEDEECQAGDCQCDGAPPFAHEGFRRRHVNLWVGRSRWLEPVNQQGDDEGGHGGVASKHHQEVAPVERPQPGHRRGADC